jgi:hypothetical protein
MLFKHVYELAIKSRTALEETSLWTKSREASFGADVPVAKGACASGRGSAYAMVRLNGFVVQSVCSCQYDPTFRVRMNFADYNFAYLTSRPWSSG